MFEDVHCDIAACRRWSIPCSCRRRGDGGQSVLARRSLLTWTVSRSTMTKPRTLVSEKDSSLSLPLGVYRLSIKQTIKIRLVFAKYETALSSPFLGRRTACICLVIYQQTAGRKIATSHLERLSITSTQNNIYLVDPASSHMLVSKIKPCMSKYIPKYGETADGSLNQT